MLRPVASGQAVEEVTAKLRAIADRHGPDSVAFYIGTGVVSNPTGQGPGMAFMRALG